MSSGDLFRRKSITSYHASLCSRLTGLIFDNLRSTSLEFIVAREAAHWVILDLKATQKNVQASARRMASMNKRRKSWPQARASIHNDAIVPCQTGNNKASFLMKSEYVDARHVVFKAPTSVQIHKCPTCNIRGSSS